MSMGLMLPLAILTLRKKSSIIANAFLLRIRLINTVFFFSWLGLVRSVTQIGIPGQRHKIRKQDVIFHRDKMEIDRLGWYPKSPVCHHYRWYIFLQSGSKSRRAFPFPRPQQGQKARDEERGKAKLVDGNSCHYPLGQSLKEGSVPKM